MACRIQYWRQASRPARLTTAVSAKIICAAVSPIDVQVSVMWHSKVDCALNTPDCWRFLRVEKHSVCSGLGIKLVLVLGASQQIDAQLLKRGLQPNYKNGYRITDADAMLAVMEAAGATRTEMEANLSKVQSPPLSSQPISVSCCPTHAHRLRKAAWHESMREPCVAWRHPGTCP